MDKEIWIPISGYEGLYEISNMGRVKGLKSGKILKQHLTGKKKKYLQVCLCKNAVRKSPYVSRLVWKCFNGNIPEGMEVNHKNEDTKCNELSNFNLLTRKENCNWGNHRSNISEACSKPVNQYDKKGNFIKQYKNSGEAALAVGLASGSNIRACCLHYKRYKTAAGYIWEYANTY